MELGQHSLEGSLTMVLRDLSVWDMLSVESTSRVLGGLSVAVGALSAAGWATGHIPDEVAQILTPGFIGGGTVILFLGWLFSTRELDRPMHVSR